MGHLGGSECGNNQTDSPVRRRTNESPTLGIP